MASASRSRPAPGRCPRIFSLIQERGDIADDEMVRTFNLGIGMTASCDPEHVDVAVRAVPEAVRVGTRGAGGGGRAARRLL